MNLRGLRTVAVFGSIAVLVVLSAAAQDVPRDASAPWLGVYLVDEVDGGIRIVAVVPGGPAFRAGLRSGDLLIEAENVQLADQEALERVLSGFGSGRELQVAVLRNGESRTFRLRPAARPRPPAFAAPKTVTMTSKALLASTPWLLLDISSGLKTVSITEELRAHYGVSGDRGVLVVRVVEDGPGGRAGIEVGDVLVGVGTEPLTTPAEVERVFARRDRSVALKIELVRNRKSRVVNLAAEPPRVPAAAFGAWFGKDARAKQLERSIILLEEQLETLRKQLAELNDDPDPPAPASPDR